MHTLPQVAGSDNTHVAAILAPVPDRMWRLFFAAIRPINDALDRQTIDIATYRFAVRRLTLETLQEASAAFASSLEAMTILQMQEPTEMGRLALWAAKDVAGFVNAEIEARRRKGLPF